VGYRCPECVRGQQKVFDTSTSIDFVLAGGIAFVLVALATAVLRFLGFWGLFLSPVVGGGIAGIIQWAVRRRRSRRLPLVAAAGGALGAVAYMSLSVFPYLAVFIFGVGFDPAVLISFLPILLWPLAYGVIMIGTMNYRLKGIRL
jgi:cytochrome bd-type quinol oxidase subunit 2